MVRRLPANVTLDPALHEQERWKPSASSRKKLPSPPLEPRALDGTVAVNVIGALVSKGSSPLRVKVIKTLLLFSLSTWEMVYVTVFVVACAHALCPASSSTAARARLRIILQFGFIVLFRCPITSF